MTIFTKSGDRGCIFVKRVDQGYFIIKSKDWGYFIIKSENLGCIIITRKPPLPHRGNIMINSGYQGYIEEW